MGLPDLPSYLRARGRRPPGSDARSQAEAALQAFLTRDVVGGHRLLLRSTALRGRVRGARGRGVQRLRARARRHPGRRPRDRVRGGRAGRRPDARARRRAPRRAARAARRRVRDRRRARARRSGREPRAGRPAPAPAPDGAAPVGRRRAGARPDRVGAHGRRSVARDPARDRPAPPDRRLPARARGGGSAAGVLLARRAPHAALGRARLGAAPVRARLRARRPAGGADRLAAVRPGAAGRAGRDGLRAPLRADGRDLRGPGRRATTWSRGCAARSRWSAAWSRASCAPTRRWRGSSTSLGACLRAILRDVLCGHLDPDLRRVADELLADVAPAPSAMS